MRIFVRIWLMFSSSSWSTAVNLYWWYNFCVREKSCAALHSLATQSLNSRMVSISLLYMPRECGVSSNGSLLPNRMSSSKSRPSILWSPGIVSGSPNGSIQAPMSVSEKSLVPRQASIVRLPWLCVAGVMVLGCCSWCKSISLVVCNSFPYPMSRSGLAVSLFALRHTKILCPVICHWCICSMRLLINWLRGCGCCCPEHRRICVCWVLMVSIQFLLSVSVHSKRRQ